ncbi:putative annexin [Lineolata rhizophorae]|uniref:Annexin n=1 Tax=Lineolata rhizophorae TaxID=578093 RepID=A0A6A6P7X7_9PEZI|nr:putative annexin [Lineolata rhizophorae]
MNGPAEGLKKAMKGFGTNEKELIKILSKPDPVAMASLRKTYDQRFISDLMADIKKEVSGDFEDALLALVRGPLAQDVYNLRKAMEGAGTDEEYLNDVLLGRSNADINAIKDEYQRTYKRALESDIKAELSSKTEQLFIMVLSARRTEESVPVDPRAVEADVDKFQAAVGGFGNDASTVADMFSSRSNSQLRALSQAYEQRFHKSLARVIEKEFSGHMEDALLRILGLAVDPAKADADAIEATMKGMGTRDELLMNRVIRVHWNREHCAQVKRAYKHFYKKDLEKRIKDETKGDFEKILLACIE